MVLSYGTGEVNPDWEVVETASVGYTRIYYIYGGYAEYTDKYVSQKLVKGNLYIFPSTHPYSMHHNPQNPLNCLFIHLDITVNIVNKLICCDVPNNTFLFSFFKALEYPIKERDDVLVNEMLGVFETYCLKNKIFHYPSKEIGDAFLYILENFKNDISLDCLSKCAGYSKEYFIRQFKHYYGISPYQCLKNIRLNECLKELKENKPIAEAAYNAGYTDVKNFCRAFKSKFNVSASDWKKLYLKSNL